jgi:hypothetical protein
MKRLLSVILLALALPMSAFAVKSVYFGNSGGTIAGTSAGLNLTNSELVIVNGLKALNGGAGGDQIMGDLGTVSLSTGKLVSGSPEMGGVFAGGTFTVTGNGERGIPNGTIFTGTFRGPVSWTMVTLANGTHAYTLSGILTGTWYTDATGRGATVLLTINTGTDFFEGSVDISKGDASITVTTPE